MVLAPDYHHGNEIFALRAAGVRIRYVPVQRDLELDLDALVRACDRRARILYVTHFIGWPQPMDALRQICREKDLILVEDCALSLFASAGDEPLGGMGDYGIFCLYKTLPLPHGGVLVKNAGRGPELEVRAGRRPGRLSVAARLSELIAQWIRSRHERTGAALFAAKRGAGRALDAVRLRRAPVGDTGFDTAAADLEMAPICHRLLQRISYDGIVERRRKNFRFLADRLGGIADPVRADLAEGVCPLFLPLLVQDKTATARRLRERGIEAIEFWNQGDPEAEGVGSGAPFLRRHVLEIPIHQEITEEQLEWTARQLAEIAPGLAE